MTPASPSGAAPSVACALLPSIDTQHPDVISAARSKRGRNRSKPLKTVDQKPSKPLSDHEREELEALARDVADGHREFEQWLKATAARAINIGELGFKAKRIARHGHFGPWKEHLRTEYGIAERSLERYMYLYKNRRKLLALTGASDLGTDDAARSLQSVKVQEALEFLKQSAKPNVTKSAVRPKDVAPSPPPCIPDSVAAIARELFGKVDFVVCDERFSAGRIARRLTPSDAPFDQPDQWRGKALIHADEQQLASMLPLAKQMYEHGPLHAALLLAPVVTDHPALQAFHACPRAFFRQRLCFAAGDDGPAACQPYMLIYLGPADGVAAFHYAAGGAADVYVPYATE